MVFAISTYCRAVSVIESIRPSRSSNGFDDLSGFVRRVRADDRQNADFPNFWVTLDLFTIDSRRFGFRRKQMNYKQSHRISRSRDSEKTLAFLLKLKISETLFRFLALYRQTGRLRSARCFFILRNIGQEITRQRKLLLIWYRHC